MPASLPTHVDTTACTDSASAKGQGLVLLVTMPALNEERSIAQVIRRVPREIPGIRQVDILVVDDGSTDRTVDLALAEGATVVSHNRQRGVGAAFQTALSEGIDRGADLIVSIDSDGQFAPETIPQLIDPVISGQADFATASRFKDPELIPDMPWIKKWGNRMMSRLISRLAGETFYDVSCGMRCYSNRAALQLQLLGRFTYTQEVFLNLAFKHLRIAEVPIGIRGVREHGKSRVASNLFSYAWRTTQIIFRCYRDFHPLRFFGLCSAVLFFASLCLGIFFLTHYLETGAFRPHTWTAVLSGGFLAGALAALHIGMIGDILNRHRIYLEEILYRQRRMWNLIDRREP